MSLLVKADKKSVQCPCFSLLRLVGRHLSNGELTKVESLPILVL